MPYRVSTFSLSLRKFRSILSSQLENDWDIPQGIQRITQRRSNTQYSESLLHGLGMDQWESTQQLDSSSVSPTLLDPSHDSRQRFDTEVKDPVVARKVQKADREKLRRDKQNEHFLELGNTIDPDRPKNDKATILTDTIQLLKDLVNEVNRLKTEHASLSEESRELSQEKNELRDEKASLKSDVDNLNRQYQQRVRSMYPWTAMDSPVVVAPSYSYPVPVSVAPAPITMHPSLQPFHFFGNQNYGSIPNPCSNFIPYPNRNNPQNEHVIPKASTSHGPNKQDHKTKTSDSIDVATELELKTPGSAAHSDMSSIKCKGKQSQKKEKNVSDRHSSSSRFEDSSSNSVGHLPEATSNTRSSGN